MNKITFNDFALTKEVKKGIENMGYIQPSKIQEKTIPLLLEGQDIIAQAQTGTGKTLAFGSVLLSKIKHNQGIQACVLSPTRELALQIHDELKKIGKYTSLSITCVYGGSEIEKQIKQIKRGTDIVVGTPGRVLDLLHRRVLKFDDVKFMVLDEADEMLNMGFIEDIEDIFKTTPQNKQTMLFSATIPSDMKKIASFYMQHDYRHVQVKAKSITASTVSQYYFETTMKDKLEVLCRILDSHQMDRTLIFCRTKKSVDELTALLQQKHYNVEAIHGDFSQNQRFNTLKRFKGGQTQYLIATDVAARGIDVENITHVINYELPSEDEIYVHRIGRTGRANHKGIAYSIVTKREKEDLKRIERKTNSHIERLEIPSYQDIFDMKMKELLFDIQEEILKGQLKSFHDVVEDIPHYMRNDMLAALLSMNLHQRIGFDYKDENRNEDFCRLMMNCGTIDGIKRNDMIDFLVNMGKIKRSDIKNVEVKRKSTLVDVNINVSQQLIKNCGQYKLKKRKIEIRVVDKK